MVRCFIFVKLFMSLNFLKFFVLIELFGLLDNEFFIFFVNLEKLLGGILVLFDVFVRMLRIIICLWMLKRDIVIFVFNL